MTLAHEALTVVLREHAGFLKSFESDDRKRLVAAYRIIQRQNAENAEFNWANYEPQHKRHEAWLELSRPRIIATVNKLMTLAPEYVHFTYRQMDRTTFTTASDVMDEFCKYIHPRMRETKLERLEQAEQLELDFRDELAAMHLLGQPTGTTSIDWRCCITVPTMNGRVPVAPLRIALNTKLKSIIMTPTYSIPPQRPMRVALQCRRHSHLGSGATCVAFTGVMLAVTPIPGIWTLAATVIVPWVLGSPCFQIEKKKKARNTTFKLIPQNG